MPMLTGVAAKTMVVASLFVILMGCAARPDPRALRPPSVSNVPMLSAQEADRALRAYAALPPHRAWVWKSDGPYFIAQGHSSSEAAGLDAMRECQREQVQTTSGTCSLFLLDDEPQWLFHPVNGRPVTPLVADSDEAMRNRLLAGCGLIGLAPGLPILLATGCTTPPSASPERRAEIRDAADACLAEHPSVRRYEMDRFGHLSAWYHQNQGQTGTAATSPFFDCVQARLASAPAPTTVGSSSEVGEDRWPETLPLPDDTKIRLPAPYVVIELQPFSGRWVGLADRGRVAAGLVVEELRPPVARVIVSLFSDGVGRTWRRDAQIQGEGEALTLIVEEIDGGPASIRYRLQPDGTVFMRFDNGTGRLTTMTLRRVP
jgi:hypothetical protein